MSLTKRIFIILSIVALIFISGCKKPAKEQSNSSQSNSLTSVNDNSTQFKESTSTTKGAAISSSSNSINSTQSSDEVSNSSTNANSSTRSDLENSQDTESYHSLI